MNILTSGSRLNAQPEPSLRIEKAKTEEPSWSVSAEPKDGWVSAACSVAAGATALIGTLSGRPLLAASGIFLNGVANSFTSHRVQQQGMDQAAWVSLAGGGLAVASAAIMLATPATLPIQQGPLPQLIHKLGFHGL